MLKAPGTGRGTTLRFIRSPDHASSVCCEHPWNGGAESRCTRTMKPPGLGANSLIITVFGEEEQSGDGCEHALELVDRAAVAAAFSAEHPPCLHLCHGVLDGGADLAEDRVEFTLPVQEFRSAE